MELPRLPVAGKVKPLPAREDRSLGQNLEESSCRLRARASPSGVGRRAPASTDPLEESIPPGVCVPSHEGASSRIMLPGMPKPSAIRSMTDC